MSTARPGSLFLLSYGNYEKELEELKKLLQKTTEEMKACCANQLTQDRDCEESERVCEELLEDVRQELFEISRDLEENPAKDSSSEGITELRQTAEENNAEFLASIRAAEEVRMQVRENHPVDLAGSPKRTETIQSIASI